MNHGVPWAFQLWLSGDGDGDPEVVALLEKRVWRSPGLTKCGSGTAVDKTTLPINAVLSTFVFTLVKQRFFQSEQLHM